MHDLCSIISNHVYFIDVHVVVILCACACASSTVIELMILSYALPCIVIMDKDYHILRSRHVASLKLKWR